MRGKLQLSTSKSPHLLSRALDWGHDVTCCFSEMLIFPEINAQPGRIHDVRTRGLGGYWVLKRGTFRHTRTDNQNFILEKVEFPGKRVGCAPVCLILDSPLDC